MKNVRPLKTFFDAEMPENAGRNSPRDVWLNIFRRASLCPIDLEFYPQSGTDTDVDADDADTTAHFIDAAVPVDSRGTACIVAR